MHLRPNSQFWCHQCQLKPTLNKPQSCLNQRRLLWPSSLDIISRNSGAAAAKLGRDPTSRTRVWGLRSGQSKTLTQSRLCCTLGDINSGKSHLLLLLLLLHSFAFICTKKCRREVSKTPVGQNSFEMTKPKFAKYCPKFCLDIIYCHFNVQMVSSWNVKI